jgi:tRNA 2-thiouridine synthesizing protein A
MGAMMVAPRQSVTGSSLFNSLFDQGAGGNETIGMEQPSIGLARAVDSAAADSTNYPDRLSAIVLRCNRRIDPAPTQSLDTFAETLMNYDKEFDASGLACPMPIVKTKKSLADMASGQVLRVVATDPGSVRDMQAFAEQTGNTLLSSTTENSKYIFHLRKA